MPNVSFAWSIDPRSVDSQPHTWKRRSVNDAAQENLAETICHWTDYLVLAKPKLKRAKHHVWL